jgi:hypothetical protein
MKPPSGEFTCMNYRISTPFSLPISIAPRFEQVSPNSIVVDIRVSAHLPDPRFVNNLVLRFTGSPSFFVFRFSFFRLVFTFQAPRSTQSVGFQKSDPATLVDYDKSTRVVSFTIKKLKARADQSLQARVMLETNATDAVKKEFSAIS